MNQTRLQQLLSHIKRTISTILSEVDHEHLHDVVVTDVMLDNDQQKCRIIVRTDESRLRLLNTRFRPQIQQKFRQLYQRRSVPHLVFIQDDHASEMIDTLLAQANGESPS